MDILFYALKQILQQKSSILKIYFEKRNYSREYMNTKRFCKLVAHEIGPSQVDIFIINFSFNTALNNKWTFYYHESNVKLIFCLHVINYGEDLSRTKELHVLKTSFEIIPTENHSISFYLYGFRLLLIGIPLNEKLFAFNSKFKIYQLNLLFTLEA